MKRLLLLGNHEIVICHFRRELVERLLRDGWEVWMSFPRGPHTAEFERMGCRFMDTPVSGRGRNPIQDAGLLAAYLLMLMRLRPQAVLTYTVKPNLYGGLACRAMHIPCLANITGLGSAAGGSGFLQKLIFGGYRLAMKDAFCIFFQNKGNQAVFRRYGVAPLHQELLPGSGVNLACFSPLTYPEGRRVRFVFIARVMREKGIDHYLEAARILKAGHPEIEFHIVGAWGRDYRKMLESAQSDGDVICHGWTEDVREVLAQMHCTVHPSYYPEGMSNVLLESAACARPVITTDCDGCREPVEDGVTGFLCMPHDTPSLVDALERFLTLTWEQRRAMGLAGRARMERYFDREIVVQAYLKRIEALESDASPARRRYGGLQKADAKPRHAGKASEISGIST